MIVGMQGGKVSQFSVEQLEEHQKEIRTILREFSENTTVHGLKYTTLESGRGVRRSLNKARKSAIPPGYEETTKLLLLETPWLSDTYNATLNASNLISKRTGNKYGLTVIANIQQNEYLLGDGADSAGLRVLLHGYNETPLVEGRGFDVAPGKATKVSVEMMTVKNLPPPYTTIDGSSCVDISYGKSPRSLDLFKEYDLNACRFECRYDYIFSECQCRGSYDPDEFMDNDMYKNCNCPVPCEWSSYSTRVSMGDYPSLALMEIANRTSNYTYTEAEYRQNFLKLTIAYDAFLLETVKQVPKYTVESIISAFGGQMGMFLGVSLLSVVEFVELLIQLIVVKIRRKPTNKPGENLTE
ncbi:acid-sensing ion channel 1A-like [Liolophura sinensis]|uniref:acid-sensing ion channel 1A-like n=1 Tax=Liolophura sinensis TaxID=3198878 RepID=UPI0031597B10